MSSPQFPPRTCRPRDLVVAAGRDYPGAWAHIDRMRAERGKSLPNWPDFCFLPLSGAYAIVAADAGVDRLVPHHLHLMPDVARLGALAAWRMTHGIYRYDPAVYEAVCSTPVAGDIPHEVLYRLPEWCVYVETPGLAFGASALHGVFAHLEWDARTGRPEFRLLLDGDAGLVPIPLHLGAWPLAEAIERFLAEAAVQGRSASIETGSVPESARAHLRNAIEPITSLLLYLCSQAAEIGDGTRRPANPVPKRVKGGWRLFAADRPTTWDVGVRLGAALRRAYQAEQTGDAAPHAGPRPHIRRAHWHGFWSGPHDGERRYDLRWLPPIAVNVADADADELPAVVRGVS